MKKVVLACFLVIAAFMAMGQNTLTVVAPNGGENWVRGCPAIIQWTTSNLVGTVKIDLYGNDQFYLNIAQQLPPGMTSFTWIVPMTVIPGNQFKVRVAGLTSSAQFDFSDNYFSVTGGNVAVTSPNGGETWVKGTMHPVTWTTNLCGNVGIELWKGGILHSMIAQSVPANVPFNWTIPNVNTLVPGNDYKVRVKSLANVAGTTLAVYDDSDAPFSILEPQGGAISVIVPNGGETWIAGCPANIAWVAPATLGPVKIELFRSDVFQLTICSQTQPGQATFTWIPPASIVPANDYKVKVSSLSPNNLFDFSDNPFSIIRGTISVVSPNGGENWVKGTMHPITWTDNICENVRIELWKGGIYHSLIAQSVPSNGQFNWLVPNTATLVPANDYKVKIIGVGPNTGTTNLVFDFSDNNFSIASGPTGTPVVVVTPNGGENWVAGCPGLISWVSVTAPAPPVKLELYRNDQYCLTIAQQVPAGQSQFTWVPPYTLLPGSNYKVKVTLLSSAGGFDFSDNSFSIIRGTITVTAPNGGEVWAKGSMHPVTWIDNVCQHVRIELWKGGQYHSLIAASTPSSGIFNWFIPNVNTLVPGNDYKIRVMSGSNVTGTTAMVFDFSDDFFTIAPGPQVILSPVKEPGVFPNPFSDCLRIETGELTGESAIIELFSFTGNPVYAVTVKLPVPTGFHEINTSGLMAGRYLLVIRAGGQVSRRNVVLIR